MAAIALEGVRKSWSGARGVDEVSFDAPAGRLVVLLGPSGCGKSTTLRLIAGLESADAGRISIDGDDVTALPPAQRHISMVFQSYALFPHLSVADNIVFGLQVRRVGAGEQRRRLDRVAALLGLAPLLARKPSQLSGGQQQRVALGRAIIAEQPVCLMDEPLSNLDAKLRNEMRREIRALQRQLGITMVYVTHDQAEAMSMADQVVLLRDGRVEQDAAPEELYSRPATAFAASFVGTPPMNLVAAPALAAAGWQPAGEAVDGTLVGVRPEDIRIDPAGPVHTRVGAVEYLGADALVSCPLGDAERVVRASGRRKFEVGATIALAWDRAAEHRFDAATGRRSNH